MVVLLIFHAQRTAITKLTGDNEYLMCELKLAGERKKDKVTGAIMRNPIRCACELVLWVWAIHESLDSKLFFFYRLSSDQLMIGDCPSTWVLSCQRSSFFVNQLWILVTPPSILVAHSPAKIHAWRSWRPSSRAISASSSKSMRWCPPHHRVGSLPEFEGIYSRALQIILFLYI